MKINDLLQISWQNLIRNRRRAALTMLGIVIGVMSVILMLSVGQAAENYILSQVAAFGSDLLIVRSGPGDGSGGTGPPNMMQKQTVDMDDYDRLRRENWIEAISATYYTDLLVEYQNVSITNRIAGITQDELIMYDTEMKEGAFISEADVDSRTRVAVLGVDVAKELFGQENPIGNRIKIKKQSYRVIGILGESGTRFFTNLDQVVYVPITTLLRDLAEDYVLFLNVKVGDLPIEEAKERIRIILRDTHNLDNPEGDLSEDDFFIAGQEDTAERAGLIGDILQILLASIAAISLIVGGVGIMNIMFVTVTERTREIGLRKAVGAKKGDILSQFLIEAIVLCIVGGIIGVILGISISWLGIQALRAYESDNWIFVIPWSGVVLGLLVSTAIGIIFGYIPARRASNYDAIKALQYE
ncbi:FtsX-like permease family protein [Candidatus Uhrbacteria bacterium]|nr:FtsX-like permease family protein [Candidatus Uhrbacteria bacterium]